MVETAQPLRTYARGVGFCSRFSRRDDVSNAAPDNESCRLSIAPHVVALEVPSSTRVLAVRTNNECCFFVFLLVVLCLLCPAVVCVYVCVMCGKCRRQEEAEEDEALLDAYEVMTGAEVSFLSELREDQPGSHFHEVRACVSPRVVCSIAVAGVPLSAAAADTL